MANFATEQLKRQRPRADAKYPHLVEHLTAQIRAGKLCPGDRLPTFVQLQAKFGVTPQTVNRAMIALEQDGLIVRRPGGGTFILDAPRPRAKGIIGLCGYGLRRSGSSSYWTHLLEVVRSGAEVSGSQILLLPHNVSDGWEKVDGVLISDLAIPYHCNLIPHLPLVCLFGNQEKRTSIVADEYSGLRQATEHLLVLGHRRIAYLHGQNQTNVPKRLKGYNDTLREAGITPRKSWLRSLSGKNDFGPQFLDAGRSGMAEWISDKGPKGWKEIGCTALLCHNDDTAIGALQALSKAGFKVPDDVSVIGFDGTQVGEYSSPRLTSIEMPLQQMGETAIQILQKQIGADEVLVEHHVLPTQLRVRQSTAAPPHH